MSQILPLRVVLDIMMWLKVLSGKMDRRRHATQYSGGLAYYERFCESRP